jgi:hypothetical protein
MGTQRCRLRVIIPESVRSTSQRNSRGEKKMELVVMPEMRRIGDSKGGALDREEVVSGCKGEYNSFSAA